MLANADVNVRKPPVSIPRRNAVMALVGPKLSSALQKASYEPVLMVEQVVKAIVSVMTDPYRARRAVSICYV